jgi:hypothetical protein
LTRESFSIPTFNPTAASWHDSPISYDDMHERVKILLHDPDAKFYVENPASLLELNKDNWKDWLGKHLKE